VALSEGLKSARAHLSRLANELEVIQLQMLGIQKSLPEPPAEAFPLLDIEAMDPATEMRTVIACVVNDRIGPAIRDLRDALAETAEPITEGPPAA
jgi:hypothetical protein